MFACYTKKIQLLKFSSVYCLCEMKSPQASILALMTGPSCVQEDLANLDLVKIFYVVYVSRRYFLSSLT